MEVWLDWRWNDFGVISVEWLCYSNATDNDTTSGAEESDYSFLFDMINSYTEDITVESTTLDLSDVYGRTETEFPTDELNESSNTVSVKELPSNSASVLCSFCLQFNILIVISKMVLSNMTMWYVYMYLNVSCSYWNYP